MDAENANNSKQKYIAFGLIPIICVILYVLFTGWGYDDPYITYRYSRNLVQGSGFVYNHGEHTLSTTTPLFTLLLAFIGIFRIDIHQAAIFIGVLSLAIGGYFIWDLGMTNRKPALAWYGLCLYPLFPLCALTLSSETPLYLALVLGAFAWISRDHQGFASIFIALAILTRPDGLLPLILIGAYLLLSRKGELDWKALLILVLIILPWVLFAEYSFGTPLPSTLSAKQAQARMTISEQFSTGLLTVLQQGYLSRPGYWLMVAFLCLGLLDLARNRNFLGIILLWSTAHFAAYSALGMPRYFWYYAPLIPGIIILSGLGFDRLARMLLQRRKFPVVLMVSGSLLLFTILDVTSHLLYLRKNPDERVQVYSAAGAWIRSNTPSSATVGTLEVGIIGFYSNRRMIDFAGLIQPDISEIFTSEATYEDSASYGIQQYRPDYLVLSPSWFPNLAMSIIDPNCILQQTYNGQDFASSVSVNIYKCNWEILPRISSTRVSSRPSNILNTRVLDEIAKAK